MLSDGTVAHLSTDIPMGLTFPANGRKASVFLARSLMRIPKQIRGLY